MRVFNDVEGLIYYANVHLMLDELDIVLVRNQLLDLLKLENYIISEIDCEMIENLNEPSTLLNPILEYAVGAGIVQSDNVDTLASKIMGLLILRPSDIVNVVNGGLRKPQKITEWFYDYNIKSNYINILEQAHNKHWEAKGTTGKIEVAILQESTFKDSDTKYPECDICIENEGFHAHNKHTLRTVPIVLGEQDDWFWYYVSRNAIAHQINIVNNNHTKSKWDISSLDLLFDFNDILPHFFVGFLQSIHQKHQHLIGGYKLLPLFKAKLSQVFKCAEFPLVEIGRVDWYSTVLRISGVEKKYMLECTKTILQKWTSMDSNNTFGACLHKDKEGKFVLELFLNNNNVGQSILKSDVVTLLDIMGVVHLDSNLIKDIGEMERYLTKEIKYIPDRLPTNLTHYKSLIEKLVKEVGNSKLTALEAELTLKDEINLQCEELLKGMQAFDIEDGKTLWDSLGFIVK